MATLAKDVAISLVRLLKKCIRVTFYILFHKNLGVHLYYQCFFCELLLENYLILPCSKKTKINYQEKEFLI